MRDETLLVSFQIEASPEMNDPKQTLSGVTTSPRIEESRDLISSAAESGKPRQRINFIPAPAGELREVQGLH